MSMTQWFKNRPSVPLHLDPEGLSETVLRVIGQLHTEQTRYESACREYASAHVQYRLRKAQEILKAEGTQLNREAMAQVAVQHEHMAHIVAETKMGAMRERILTLRAELTALQSLLATQRAEWGAASAVQKYGA
jgi:hypothetical protein